MHNRLASPAVLRRVTTPAPAVLYFDARCGPCTFFARATRGLSRSPLPILPLDGPEADRTLGGMASDLRFGSFHIVEGGRTVSGPGAMPTWIGLIAGRPGLRIAKRTPPVEWLLRSAYLRLWTYRGRHGCSAPPSSPGTEPRRSPGMNR